MFSAGLILGWGYPLLSKEDIGARELENANALVKILSVIATEEKLEDMLEHAVDELLSVSWLRLLPKGGIFLLDEIEQVLHLAVGKNLPPELHTLCAKVPLGHCLCGKAAMTGEVQFANCIDEQHNVLINGVLPHGHYNVPILMGKKVIGMLLVCLSHGHKKNDVEINFLNGVSNALKLVIQVKRKEESLQRNQKELEKYLSDLDLHNASFQRHAEDLVVSYEMQNQLLLKTEKLEQEALYASRHDLLTNLPNRRYFLLCSQEAISDLSEQDGKGALLFLDIDGFKAINDTMGHGAGDELLETIAKRLQAGARETDIVGRIGGDEFIVFLNGVSSLEQGKTIAQKIVKSLGQPYHLEEGIARVSASCGMSVSPEHADNIEALINLADKAMYAVKTSGKNNVLIVDTSV